MSNIEKDFPAKQVFDRRSGKLFKAVDAAFHPALRAAGLILSRKNRLSYPREG